MYTSDAQTLPHTIVLIRHARSEGNEASRQPKPVQNQIHQIPSARWRLTDKGRQQARKAGEFIRQHLLPGLPDDIVFYSSPFARAMETAGELGISDRWYIDPLLHERDWGAYDLLADTERAKLLLQMRKQDPLFTRIIDGESIADVLLRIRSGPLNTWARQHADQAVVAVTHGETMQAFALAMEKMSPQEFKEYVNNSREKIRNCTIVMYSRYNLQGELTDHIATKRVIDPIFTHSDTGWKPIKKGAKTSKELLDEVSQIIPVIT